MCPPCGSVEPPKTALSKLNFIHMVNRISGVSAVGGQGEHIGIAPRWVFLSMKLWGSSRQGSLVIAHRQIKVRLEQKNATNSHSTPRPDVPREPGGQG
jgi:hypothetical protein